jgi:hypothetical protein
MRKCGLLTKLTSQFAIDRFALQTKSAKHSVIANSNTSLAAGQESKQAALLA